MFYFCTRLHSIGNMPNLTTGNNMFTGCMNLRNIEGLNTSNVVNAYGMFDMCYNLTDEAIANLDYSELKNAYRMFAQCNNLTSFNIESNNLEIISGMFYGCTNMQTLTIHAPKAGGTDSLFSRNV